MTDPQPHPNPMVAVSTSGERDILEAFVEGYREQVRGRVAGVSEEAARRRLVGSATTLGGIIKHLRWVELAWFERVLAQRPEDELPTRPGNADDPDADFRLEDDETLDQILAAYERQCEISRTVAKDFSLDDTGPHRRFGDVSLRWIYVHMIEETACHAGHADILRELIDGSVNE
ncbi:MAG: DinB family protein [Geodermatophilaceae bacterium]